MPKWPSSRGLTCSAAAARAGAGCRAGRSARRRGSSQRASMHPRGGSSPGQLGLAGLMLSAVHRSSLSHGGLRRQTRRRDARRACAVGNDAAVGVAAITGQVELGDLRVVAQPRFSLLSRFCSAKTPPGPKATRGRDRVLRHAREQLGPSPRIILWTRSAGRSAPRPLAPPPRRRAQSDTAVSVLCAPPLPTSPPIRLARVREGSSIVYAIRSGTSGSLVPRAPAHLRRLEPGVVRRRQRTVDDAAGATCVDSDLRHRPRRTPQPLHAPHREAERTRRRPGSRTSRPETRRRAAPAVPPR